ncbi:hypothetical protein Tco_1079079 [Tanacetum coccineum]|uniref:Uncharacterized protein n=1 Tax=Tanacetum coccineum TaxID=301880 RepID=A0ABQ5HQZ2_9ASTR
MASKSTSSQQSSHLSPSSKVNFKCEEGIIAYNNAVALLEHSNVLCHPMLSFQSNYETTKTITFSLSSVEKSLSFTQEEFISTTGLPVCKNVVPTPPKEIVRAGLYLSMIFEKLLGENYINGDLTFVKPYTISASSFQTTLASEVSFTSHMLKVDKLFQEHEQSLILSFEKVNADDSVDKSLSRTTVILPKKQVTETQHTKERVAIADATKSLEASESVLVQKDQEEVKEFGLESIGDITFDQIMDEINQKNKAAQETPEIPFDTESEIKIIKKFQPTKLDDDAQIAFLSVEPSPFEHDHSKSTKQGDFDFEFGLHFMPDDDLVSLIGLETPDSVDNHSNKGTPGTFNAFIDMPAQSDPFGHLHKLHILNTNVNQLESSITKKVSDDV